MIINLGVEIVNNRAVIKHIADAIHLCGSHNIPLRGHRDDNTADVHSNKSNFLAILDYSVRSGNTTLAEHYKGAARNAVYTSKTIQNHLIQAIGDHIRDKIIKEIKQAKYYSILCDEVSDISNKEQVSIVLRFVDSSACIREFLDLLALKGLLGKLWLLKSRKS